MRGWIRKLPNDKSRNRGDCGTDKASVDALREALSTRATNVEKSVITNTIVGGLWRKGQNLRPQPESLETRTLLFIYKLSRHAVRDVLAS